MNRRRAWTIAVVLYLLFIYSNSMKPATLSSMDSGTALLIVQRVFHGLGLDSGWITEHVIRKTAHFTEYTILGMMLWNCVRTYDLAKGSRWLIHVMAGFLIPFCDETIQLFVEGRSGQISDVWLDAAGVAAGTIVIIICAWWWGNRREKRIGEKL